MCEDILLTYTDPNTDETKTEAYDPELAGHTCTCELKDTPSAPANPHALAAFGRWIVTTYLEIRNTTGECAVTTLLHMH